jgi:hypothetical protein
LALVEHVIGQGFAADEDRKLYKVVATIEELVGAAEHAPRPSLAAQPERL